MFDVATKAQTSNDKQQKQGIMKYKIQLYAVKIKLKGNKK